MNSFRTAAAALILLASSAGSAPVCPPAAPDPRLEVRLDPRVELAAALQILGAVADEPPGFRDDGSDYAKTLLASVADLGSHPAVAAYRREIAREREGGGFMTALHSLNRCLDDALVLRSDRDDCRRSAFAHAAADFADRAAFRFLMPRLEALAEPALAPVRSSAAADGFTAVFDAYVGARAGSQRLSPSPLLQATLAWNDLDQASDGSYRILTVAGPRVRDQGEAPSFDGPLMMRDIAHENAHALFNAAVDAADAAAGPPPPGAPDSCYGSWTQCAREHAAQGVSLRLIERARAAGCPADAPDPPYNDRLPWQKGVARLLKDSYEPRRAAGEGLREFAPKIVAYLRARAARLPVVAHAPAPGVATENSAAEAAVGRGLALYAQGRIDDAAAAFDEAQRLRPGPSSLMNVAAVRLAQKKTGEALAAFDAAVAGARRGEDPSPQILSDALSARAELRASTGDRAGAAADLSEALEAAPLDWERRAECEARLAKLKKR